MELERNCTLFISSHNKPDPPSTAELQKKIESPNEATKAEGMQDLIIGKTDKEDEEEGGGESPGQLLRRTIKT